MGPTSCSASLKTRFLIISETNCIEFPVYARTLQQVDVAIHYGDLTEESKLSEFQTIVQLLKAINAPLRLIIAGNHD